jgi:hypothetical protein
MIGWLPTGRRLQWYGDLVTTCHRCGGEESADHLLKCGANEERRREFVVGFNDMLGKIKTTEEIREPLASAVEDWVMGQEVKDERFRRGRRGVAMERQREIGWNMFMRGWVSNEWAKIQEHANDGIERGRDGSCTGDIWSSQVSLWLIRESKTMWQERNDERNLRTTMEGRTISRAEEEWDERITRIYEREMEVDERDRGVFRVAIGERLGMNLRGKKVWVKKMVKWLNRTKNGKKERGKQQDIRTMFQKQMDEQQNEEKEGGAEEAKLPAPQEEQAADTSRRTSPASPGARAWGSLRRPKRAEGRIIQKRIGKRKEQQEKESEQGEVAMGKKEEEKVDQIRRGRQPRRDD